MPDSFIVKVLGYRWYNRFEGTVSSGPTVLETFHCRDETDLTQQIEEWIETEGIAEWNVVSQ